MQWHVCAYMHCNIHAKFAINAHAACTVLIYWQMSQVKLMIQKP